MELRQMIKILLRRWWLVALPVVVVAAYLGLTYSSPPTVYQVVMRFAMGTEPAGLSLDYDRYYPWLTSEYVANGLADVAVTGAFAETVSARLAAEGVEVAPGAIQGAIVSDNAQSVVVLYVTWPDPEGIVPVAQAIAAELIEGGPDYFPQIPETGVAARALDAPHPVPLPPSLRSRLLGPGLRLALAFATGVGLAFLAHYVDPSVWEAREVELLGMEVLARVPRR
jgi:capsular polysaccharide biosynthesis protein